MIISFKNFLKIKFYRFIWKILELVFVFLLLALVVIIKKYY